MMFHLMISVSPVEEVLKYEKNRYVRNLILNQRVKGRDEEDRDAVMARYMSKEKLLLTMWRAIADGYGEQREGRSRTYGQDG